MRKWILVLVVVLSVAGSVGLGQQSQINATRTLPDDVEPGDTVSVTVRITFGEDGQGVSLLENFPNGFEFVGVTQAADATVFTDRDEADIIFFWGLSTFDASTTIEVRYQLRASNNEGNFEFSGQLLVAEPATESDIAGDQTLVVGQGGPGNGGSQNHAPVAAFSASSDRVSVGTAIGFTDQSSDPDGNNDLAQWRWEFGDGTLSEQRSPQHAYVAAGEFTVRLTVTDQAGATAATTQRITVTEGSPEQSATEAIASLFEDDPAGADNPDLLIGDREILKAVELWVRGEPVPGTAGETIGDALILEFIKLWITGEAI